MVASLITAQLLFLEAENPKKEISMYINSPGGVVTSGMAIYDTMQFIRPAVATLCIGQAASMGSLLLAELVPDRFQEMVVRAAEYGNDRIIMGAHYAMDVLGGRTVATYDLAHLLANDPVYIGRPLTDFARATAMSAPRVPATIEDFRAAVVTARADIKKVLEAACGDTIAVCSRQDTGRFNAPAMTAATAPTAPTGMERMTQSASRTASDGSEW